MIVYSSTKQGFQEDVLNATLVPRIHKSLRHERGWGVGQAEVNSWNNSLLRMGQVLADDRIPNDSGICIEYGIPASAKRVDFMVTGKNADDRDNVVIVELKQWSEAAHTGMDGIVSTFVGGAQREVNHPSYQAWSYAKLLEDFNEEIYTGSIDLHPCAYLHNCSSGDVLRETRYEDYWSKAPVFLMNDGATLRNFIKDRICNGDYDGIVQRIENSPIRPSKQLADSLVSMLKNQPEFVLVDDQKLVYETALRMARTALETGRKQVLIVSGGPGTGKSVVAINLLVEMTNRGLNVRYVSKNAAPRDVYSHKLAGNMTNARIRNLFTGSGAFTGASPRSVDALIVDEAHRLNEKSGLYRNLGDNQIKEIIQAAHFTVFFIDEDQRVTLDDIGSVATIQGYARALGAESVASGKLESQFRCNGSDGYLAWLDHSLQIRQTANEYLTGIPYDFRVFDDPQELFDAIKVRNVAANRARLVAGYCWNWISRRDKDLLDIQFPKSGFAAQWNLASDGNLWAISPTGVNEVGCIHTCQGLEMDVVGVIIGPDLLIRNGRVITNGHARANTDKSLRGFRGLAQRDPAAAAALVDPLIRNTYRTLMTRGQKGCWIYSEDQETREWFRARLG